MIAMWQNIQAINLFRNPQRDKQKSCWLIQLKIQLLSLYLQYNSLILGYG